jgi:non-ribosomal peptide synthase protein (TIGR01720 family)
VSTSFNITASWKDRWIWPPCPPPGIRWCRGGRCCGAPSRRRWRGRLEPWRWSIEASTSPTPIRAEGFACTPLQLFQNQSIAELAQVVSPAVTVSAEQGEITGPVGLTPIQHWFLDSSPVAPHHFNQSLLLEVRQRIDQELLDAALKQLVAHHDALQMRFSEWEGEWQQFNEPVKEVSCLSRVDLSGLSNEAQVSSIEKCCAETQASMDLDSGLLLRAVYFDLGAERSGRLLLVIHHLVVDGVSWRVLLADLYLAYQCLIRGQGIVLPAKTTSFKEWSRRLEEYSRSEPLALEAPYWLSVQRLAAEVAFPLDSPQGENKVRDSRHVVRELDREQTETLLRKVPPVYRTQINDVLLAALVDAFRKWSGQDRMLLDLEGHGREKLLEAVDVSRTVGWFTILYPVVLHAPEEGGIGELLKSVKEQLRAIPGRGIGYGVLRYLDESEVGKALREGPQAKLSFNYLGQLERGLAEQGDLFAAATESQGSGRSPEGNCQYTVDVTGLVFGERLRMTWRYSENLHTRETMERFADAYQESLQQIIQHCLDPEAGGYTPSDFELAGLDQEQLDSLLTQVGQRKHR